MPVIETQLNPRSEAFKDSARAMQALVADLEAQLARIALGGGDAPRAKHLARGKLLPRDASLAALSRFRDEVAAALRQAPTEGSHPCPS